MDALDAFLVTSRAQQEDKQRQAHGKRNGGDGNQDMPVFHQKVRIIRLLIDIVLRRQGASDVAGDGHVLIVKALIGNVGVDIAHGACLVGLGCRRGFRFGIVGHKRF